MYQMAGIKKKTWVI